MITVDQLLKDNKYKFKHIQIEIIEQDDDSNVLVFCASYVTTTLPNVTLSDGLKEINQTLWNESSSKRPSDYWVLGGSEENGLAKSYMVADEWLDQTPTEIRNNKEREWKIKR